MSIGQWTRRLLVLFLLMGVGMMALQSYYPKEYTRWSKEYELMLERAWGEWGVGKAVTVAGGVFGAPVFAAEMVVMDYFGLAIPDGGWEGTLFGWQLIIPVIYLLGRAGQPVAQPSRSL